MSSEDAGLVGSLWSSGRPLCAPEQPDFAASFDEYSDAKVLLLGESTHGSAEFYRARAAISLHFIRNHGFNVVAFEADWPDMYDVDCFIRNRDEWGRRPVFVNFPQWVWRNSEFAAFARAVRDINLQREPSERVSFRGLDIYSLEASVTAILASVRSLSPDLAEELTARYGCLTPYHEDPRRYGVDYRRQLVDCEKHIAAQLRSVRRHGYATGGSESEFSVLQNAYVIRSVERFYRLLVRPEPAAWNERDRHMHETLLRLRWRQGQRFKAIVWTHNVHAGDMTATEMSDREQTSLGALCRRTFGSDCVSIAFATDIGEVTAAAAWGEAPRVMSLRPVTPGSWEDAFRRTGLERSLTCWRSNSALASRLDHVRGHRAIGVVYRPDDERRNHYFDTRLSAQYDALVWISATTAIDQAGLQPAGGPPDFYPFAL